MATFFFGLCAAAGSLDGEEMRSGEVFLNLNTRLVTVIDSLM